MFSSALYSRVACVAVDILLEIQVSELNKLKLDFRAAIGTKLSLSLADTFPLSLKHKHRYHKCQSP
jgi:hypothetical protein